MPIQFNSRQELIAYIKKCIEASLFQFDGGANRAKLMGMIKELSLIEDSIAPIDANYHVENVA